ncbi:6359_t:CDS:2, partial [Gigaspora margarita]
MPDSLKNFSDKSQEGITQWFKTAKTIAVQRNINKNNITNVENQQITEDLIDHLRQTYYQANQTSLGRVFGIKATVKSKFEILEHRR